LCDQTYFWLAHADAPFGAAAGSGSGTPPAAQIWRDLCAVATAGLIGPAVTGERLTAGRSSGRAECGSRGEAPAGRT
jgi:hypothetical protein